MRDMLERSDMNLEDKANMYQKILWKYLKRFDQCKDRPLGTVQVRGTEKGISDGKAFSAGPGTTSTAQGQDDVSTIEHDVLQTVLKTMKSRAERLLQRIKSHPDITWNPRGEIEYQGQLIENSNLTDLVNDVLRKRRVTGEPIEWKTFAAALRHLNVPQNLVGNPDRWRFIREKRPEESSPMQTPPPQPRNVSLSSLKKRNEAVKDKERGSSFAGANTPLARKKTKAYKHKRKQQRFQKCLGVEDWQLF